MLSTTPVPRTPVWPDEPRVVYVGHLTLARGAAELVELGAELSVRTEGRMLSVRTESRIRVELIGHADAEASLLLEGAAGVDWRGFLPHDQAMKRVDGALAGLSLLHDEPIYRVSQPTKVVEYLANGVPVITTPLPEAARLVTATGAGVVVPFGPGGPADPPAVADAVPRLDADVEGRRHMGRRGHGYARARLDWAVRSGAFVSRLGAIAGAPRPQT